MRCHAVAKTVVVVAPTTCEQRTERSVERECDPAKTRKKVEVVTVRVTATVLLFAKRERDAPRRHLAAMTKIDTQRRRHDETRLLQLMIDDLAASASETGATLMTAAARR